MKFVFIAALFAGALALVSQPSGRETVGPQPDGTFLLATGWRIQPVGQQVPVDTFPMSSALSRDGKFLLVLNGGYKPPSISVIALDGRNEIARVPVADGWLGLAFSPNGRMVYVGGGSRDSIFEFSFSSAGELKPARTIEITPASDRKPTDFIGDVAVSPDGERLYAADLFHDSIAVINLRTAGVMDHFKTGRRPYRIVFHPDGQSFFVSSWADGTVSQLEASNGNEVGRLRLGPHATDMALSLRKPEEGDVRYRLFVTAANTNSVYVVGIDDTKQMKVMESINVAMTPRHPAGMTPSGVALNKDETQLYVACADANVVAVADVSDSPSHVMGFIPTGWYPTAVRVLPSGHVVVLNGRGLRSYPNPHGPGPLGLPAGATEGDPRREYVGRMQTGTLSFVDPLTEEALEKYTHTAQILSPYRDADLDNANVPGNSVIYSTPSRPSPIEHVIYVVKENRTYDQVFGKIGKGNSDQSLALFDESSAPNHFKLAREFVLLDNYYVNADVSADGHNWASAAIAPDYVQRMWPNSYAGRRKTYDYEGTEPANSPPAGYIWNSVLSAGLSVGNFGYWLTNRKQATPDGVQVEKVNDPALTPYTDMHYRGFDLDYQDVERAHEFLAKLKEMDASGKMPRFILLRLGNDHTSGTSPGKIAPLSSFADNDYALGLVVEGVSKTQFWAKTAIFVTEDDAQNGPDHVDSHRSVGLVLSPYTRRGVIDSTFYNQTSMLRTMELILGLRPMTHFDAGSRPMASAFADTPNLSPYAAEAPRISLTTRNPPRSQTAERSERMDFSEADKIDDDELNDILWLAIRGTDPPPPVRSYFSMRP